jgi:acyl-CoA reductase-like NAD-dependent aldehyde dehydrogenase
VSASPIFRMLVGGQLRGTRGHPVHNATGALLGYAAVAGPGEVAEAVAAAKAALPGWSATTADERGRVLHGVAELLDERRGRLAADLAAAGGIAVDAAAELVDAAVDRWIWYAGWTDKIAGVLGAVHPVSGPYVGWSAPRPVGVVGAVSPSSLPGLVEALAPVLAAGATAVVVAPHERPVAAAALAEVLATAELPAGAANVLTGPVGELAPRLTGVDGLDLTGAPDDVAPDVIIAAAGRGARILAPPVIDDAPLSRLRAWAEVTTVWHPVGR